MASTIAEAWQDAEQRREEQLAVENEVVVPIGPRATIWEHLSGWDTETVTDLMWTVSGYRRKHGLPPARFSDDDEDAFQDAVLDMLRYPRSGMGEVDPDEFRAMMVFRAARRWGKPQRQTKDDRQARSNVVSLDAYLAGPDEITGHDVLPDHRSEEAAEWKLEWWYLRTYVRHLLKTTSKSVVELADEFGVEHRVIQAIIAALRREEGTGDLIPPSANSHPKTKRHVIALLKDFVRQYGHSPTYKEIQERTLELPPARHIFELFGSREAAFAAAGIESPSLRGKKADAKTLGEELVEWARAHGRWPSLKEMQEAENAGELRASATYRTHFGATGRRKLYDAVAEVLGREAMAGLERPAPRSASRGEAIASLEAFHAEEGHWPRQRDFQSRPHGLPSAIQMRRLFNTSSAEKLAAIVESERKEAA